MQKANLNILSTRPLDSQLIQEALQHHISIDCISFIQTKAIQNEELQQQLSQLSNQNITAVFTSMNAVDAVHNYINNKVSWDIYSIGNTTKQLIGEVFGAEHITGTAEDAAALADKIIEDNRKNVVFFCGDQRREELPFKLQAAQINLQEITVYHTIETAEKITKDYDGILFFSPSAIHSFFSVNKIKSNTVFFAIGNTTATAIKQYVNNHIIIADSPGKENLVKEMIVYFSTKN